MTLPSMRQGQQLILVRLWSPKQVLAQGDMFLNSSVSEGLPLAIIEASRAGLVVVATDVGGAKRAKRGLGSCCTMVVVLCVFLAAPLHEYTPQRQSWTSGRVVSASYAHGT